MSGQEFWQEFPPCSAYRYNGRPLWMHARDGTLPLTMPGALRRIFSIRRTEESRTISLAEYREMLLQDIDQLQSPGAFNTSAIRRGWIEENDALSVHLLSYEATVSSGTYIRGLVAKTSDIPAHAWRITRSSIELGCSCPG
jgi:tRNA U55 pseudouridine synthase TruB